MRDATQLASLFVSFFFLAFSIYRIFKSKPESFNVHFTMGVGWLAGVVYYVPIIFMGASYGHELSSILRLFQYICFGTWVVIGEIEKIDIQNARKGINQWKKSK